MPGFISGNADIKSVPCLHNCFIFPAQIWSDILPPALGLISNLLSLISATFSFIKYRLLGRLKLPVDIFSFQLKRVLVIHTV